MVPRPAVVLTPQGVGPEGLLIWTLMVTNLTRPDWPGDIVVPDAESRGLLIPSKIRTTKIAAVEAAAASKLGRLDEKTWDEVRERVRAYLGL